LTSTLEEGEGSASRPSLFNPLGKTPGTHLTGGSVGPGPTWILWRRK